MNIARNNKLRSKSIDDIGISRTSIEGIFSHSLFLPFLSCLSPFVFFVLSLYFDNECPIQFLLVLIVRINFNSSFYRKKKKKL